MATQKKIVSAGPDTTPKQGSTTGKAGGGTTFTPTPEAKKQALTYRLIALVLWVVAIAAEVVTIFWLIPHTEMNNYLVWLIAAIVVIGIFSVVAAQLWKKSNRYDPASKKDTVRFFVQNQLGVIITLVAFLPLIIVILANKDMDKKQKTIAGVVAIIVALIVGVTSASFDSPSTEQIDDETATVIAYTGQDKVYWVKGGSVYHLCAEYPEGTTIPPLARGDVEANPVVEGTVAQAVQAGKNRLSMYGFTECGLTEGQPQFGDLPSSIPTSLTTQTIPATPTPEPTSTHS